MYHEYQNNPIETDILKLELNENSTFILKNHSVFQERVSNYKNCQLIPYNFYIPFFNNKIIKDCSGLYNDKINLTMKRTISKKINLSGSYFYMDDAWCGNFHHWITDYIPKIMVFIKIKKELKNLKLIINKSFLKTEEIFKLLYGVCETNDIVFLDEYQDTEYTIDNLYITNPTSCHVLDPNPKYYLESYHREFHKYILDKFYDSNYQKNYDKVYISRFENSKNPSGTRKILNIIEVHKFYEHFNFKIINSELLSIYDRINIFSRTKILCGEHGGGINHIYFMEPNTKCCIISYPNLMFNQQWIEYGIKYGINVFEINNCSTLMDDKYVFKYPIHQNINFNIQSASKSWCLDLYEIEKLMNEYQIL